MTDAKRTPLIVISGLTPGLNQELARRLDGDGTAVVHHDLRGITSGVVQRLVRLGTKEFRRTLELAHGCASCTLREDLLPLLRKLSARADVQRIVLWLDEAMEPERVSWSMHYVLVGDRPVIDDVEIQAVVTTLDTATWLDDAIGDEAAAERGILGVVDDERTLAQIALAQVEFADVLVYNGSATDAWSVAKTAAVLERVTPSAVTLDLSTVNLETLLAAMPQDARRGEVEDPHGALLRGQPPLHTDCGVGMLLFSARRPFHPQRLHEAIDVLLDDVVRTRGRAWIASRPDSALWIESAGGGLGVGQIGAWLDSPEGPSWEDVSAERRTLASLRWDPEFGDRDQEIVVITHDANVEVIEGTLRGALLTDSELAAGRAAWAEYSDPFGEWHEEPCEDNETTDAASTVRNGRNNE